MIFLVPIVFLVFVLTLILAFLGVQAAWHWVFISGGLFFLCVAAWIVFTMVAQKRRTQARREQ